MNCFFIIFFLLGFQKVHNLCITMSEILVMTIFFSKKQINLHSLYF